MKQFRFAFLLLLALWTLASCKSQYELLLASNDVDAKYEAAFKFFNEKKYNKKLGRYINLRGIQEILFDAFPELKEAYDLKIGYINFNRTATLENAKEELNKQIEAFGNCNIKEYKVFYNLLKNWNKEIINSFIIVDGRRINNSHIESINRQIDRLMYNANGYINFKRARNRIMYCINKKDNYKM